jgi:hypothetical protein
MLMGNPLKLFLHPHQPRCVRKLERISPVIVKPGGSSSRSRLVEGECISSSCSSYYFGSMMVMQRKTLSRYRVSIEKQYGIFSES